MSVPLAPLLPWLMRVGAVALAGYAAGRWAHGRMMPGRTDQRAEDALDDLDEGLSLHEPQDPLSNDAPALQRNVTARMQRVIRVGARHYEVDAAVIARVRLRERSARS